MQMGIVKRFPVILAVLVAFSVFTTVTSAASADMLGAQDVYSARRSTLNDRDGDGVLEDGSLRDGMRDGVGGRAGRDVGDAVDDVIDGVGDGVGDVIDGVGDGVGDVIDGVGDGAGTIGTDRPGNPTPGEGTDKVPEESRPNNGSNNTPGGTGTTGNVKPPVETSREPITTTARPQTSGRTTENPPATSAPTTSAPITSAPTTDAADGDAVENGFNWTWLIVGLLIAAAVVVLIILLIPKNPPKSGNNHPADRDRR